MDKLDELFFVAFIKSKENYPCLVYYKNNKIYIDIIFEEDGIEYFFKKKLFLLNHKFVRKIEIVLTTIINCKLLFKFNFIY